LARFIASRRLRRRSPYTIGTSLVVSAPAAMPASICPQAILLAMMIALSSEVPQARAVVMPGVVGARPELSTASRARFQSDECLITAPSATSPNSRPCRR